MMTALKPLAIAALLIAMVPVSANAQSWGRGGAYAGPAPELNAYYRRNVQRTTSNGSVPRFCYSLRTGKFTHWGECRVVTLPTGQQVKVAH
jgi:hypothetical protein